MSKIHYQGLTKAQVEESRKKYGANVLTPPAKDPLWKQFIEKFGDPLIIILMIAGVLSIGISCYEYYGLGQKKEVFFEPVGIFVAINLLDLIVCFYIDSNLYDVYKINNALFNYNILPLGEKD